MVSSSTRLSLPARCPGSTGSSPSRVCATVPVSSEARNSVVMPCSQSGSVAWSVGISSRRFKATIGSATEAARDACALVDGLHHRRHAADQPLHI